MTSIYLKDKRRNGKHERRLLLTPSEGLEIWLPPRAIMYLRFDLAKNTSFAAERVIHAIRQSAGLELQAWRELSDDGNRGSGTPLSSVFGLGDSSEPEEATAEDRKASLETMVTLLGLRREEKAPVAFWVHHPGFYLEVRSPRNAVPAILCLGILGTLYETVQTEASDRGALRFEGEMSEASE